MTLIDTSIWSAHLSAPIQDVTELLETDRALVHPMVLGELSLSPFRGQALDLALTKLSLLEAVPAAEDQEVMDLILRFKLWGRGVGWVDCHLMAAARQADCHLLTLDKALKAAWIGVRPKY